MSLKGETYILPPEQHFAPTPPPPNPDGLRLELWRTDDWRRPPHRGRVRVGVDGSMWDVVEVHPCGPQHSWLLIRHAYKLATAEDYRGPR